MFLRHLTIKNCKLMRELAVSFVREDGSPRLWTVFVGENGTCKTTLLRAIALATAGTAFANNLVAEPPAYLDVRQRGRHPPISASIVADLSFANDSSVGLKREYVAFTTANKPPTVESSVWIMPTGVKCSSRYLPPHTGTGISPDPLDDARGRDLPHWFTAAYGVGRILSAPQSITEGAVPKRDRMKSLFDARHLPLGTAFSDRLATMFGEDRARAFARCLRAALVDHMQTPRLGHIELRGQGGANSQISLIESHRFAMSVGEEELKLPAVWLSQGYQAVISLVADIIGNVWLETGEEVPLEEMEGIVLVDELDLHLHPIWQTTIVSGLKSAFPRMQFIVTTHSPLVLAGCRADEVWRLSQDPKTGDVTAQPGSIEPMLLTGSELNRDFFGIARVSHLNEDLRRYLELSSNPYRSDAEDEEARELLKQLRGFLGDIEIYDPVERKTSP